MHLDTPHYSYPVLFNRCSHEAAHVCRGFSAMPGMCHATSSRHVVKMKTLTAPRLSIPSSGEFSIGLDGEPDGQLNAFIRINNMSQQELEHLLSHPQECAKLGEVSGPPRRGGCGGCGRERGGGWGAAFPSMGERTPIPPTPSHSLDQNLDASLDHPRSRGGFGRPLSPKRAPFHSYAFASRTPVVRAGRRAAERRQRDQSVIIP